MISTHTTEKELKNAIWNIDSFRLWRVELGKQLAERIIPELKSKEKQLFPMTAQPKT